MAAGRFLSAAISAGSAGLAQLEMQFELRCVVREGDASESV